MDHHYHKCFNEICILMLKKSTDFYDLPFLEIKFFYVRAHSMRFKSLHIQYSIFNIFMFIFSIGKEKLPKIVSPSVLQLI